MIDPYIADVPLQCAFASPPRSPRGRRAPKDVQHNHLSTSHIKSDHTHEQNTRTSTAQHTFSWYIREVGRTAVAVATACREVIRRAANIFFVWFVCLINHRMRIETTTPKKPCQFSAAVSSESGCGVAYANQNVCLGGCGCSGAACLSIGPPVEKARKR